MSLKSGDVFLLIDRPSKRKSGDGPTCEGFITAYVHLSQISVEKRDIVERGQQVGICGSTGSSTGPHLHFEWKTNNQMKWSSKSYGSICKQG
ncbi:M23 family metallopeptidase [Alkalihalobacillus sp. TS-13]|uniref:M23 family metallopeptidase n=1 Tax=Alkalihalobacillus sp. TS-13 TaxID=2842455 RepID=UPI001C868F46|nr:M23 family metallopeptidase [Alkalihalobacillus sp. TS-13]